MFIVLKRKMLIIVTLIIVAACLIGSGIYTATTMSPKPTMVVVLDAGHGGIDGGVIGVDTKTPESIINLSITKKVKTLLEQSGIGVVLTRSDDRGLYGATTQGFKQRDMTARKDIITKTAPSAVVSIHCNRFPMSNRRGAQVFFEQLSPKSKNLSDIIQTSLNNVNNATISKSFDSLAGDYFILKCSVYPSVIVECGFLSNKDDDSLLNSDDYQSKIAFAISAGIISFLQQPTT